jgi:hypothetical protein
MTYADDVNHLTITAKMEAVIEAMKELASDGDEALDAYNRDVDLHDRRNRVEWTCPTWLSYYSSTGTGAPFQDRLIEKHEATQAAHWKEYFPARADLFTCAADEGEHQEEAHEWLDAALDDEAIYLQLEAERRDGDVIIRAGFSDEINRPVGGKWFEERIDQDDFLTLDDATLETLIHRAIDTAYEDEESEL